MADYEFRGSIDSNGNINGTISKSYGEGDSGPLSIFMMISLYVLTLIGGIIMISNVAQSAPLAIIPAIIAYIILLIPIIVATRSQDFLLKLLATFYRFYYYVIALIIFMFWLLYVNESVSDGALMAFGFALMYLAILCFIKIANSFNKIARAICCGLPVLIYLIVCASVSDFVVGYLAIIPTGVCLLSLLTNEIYYIKENASVIKPIIKIVIYCLLVLFIIVLNINNNSNKQKLLQEGINYINESKYSEARKVLKDIKSDEAKELYESIRYKDVKVGEIIYNGYYSNSDQKSISEKGLGFVCLDIIDNKALYLSLDVIYLAEEHDGVLDKDFILHEFDVDIENITTTIINDKSAYFFLLSKTQFDKYVGNESLSQYLLSCNVSKYAKKQKEDVDEDTYEWTVAHTNYWLLNDFTSDLHVGTINVESGEYNYVYNLKNYAGMRPCFFANID